MDEGERSEEAESRRLGELAERFCQELRRGESPDVEDYAARHPELAGPIRELFAVLAHLEEVGHRYAEESRTADLSLSERIAQSYGEVDPGVSLEAEGEADFASELVARLGGRSAGFSRYRLKGEFARGGQGAVLRVWDEDLRRTLAMKVLLGKGEPVERGDTPRVDSKTVARFLEEAQITSQLDHPGIVPVHELGLDAEQRVYFTMKLVQGRNLREVFDLVHAEQEGWTTTRALGVLLKVCEAMAFAHDRGVVHRDLKPANVMVGRYGEVYVMDWGLARVLDRGDDGEHIRFDPTVGDLDSERRARAETPGSPLVTREGEVVGTPAYMPPEQALGRLEEVREGADVYALGAMLYHLLAGHMPYAERGNKLGHRAIWRKVRAGPPESLHTSAPLAPPELVAICEHAMARDPGARYRAMAEMAADLRAYLEGRVVHAYEAGAWAEAKKWVQRNRPLATSLVAVLLALVSGLCVALVLKAQSDRNASLAAERGLLAEQRRDDILRLSALQQLEDLIREADELWPPVPDYVDDYDDWLRRAEKLVAGLYPDLERGEVGHLAQLDELRARALPQTPDERESEARSHPRFGQLDPLRRQISALRTIQEVRDGNAEPAEVDLALHSIPDDAMGLNALARPLIDPERTEYGREAEGLALARLALERVQDDATLASVEITLAWALHANGEDHDALLEIEAAVSFLPEEHRPDLERTKAELETAIESVRGANGPARIAGLETELAKLEAELTERRDWRFEDDDDRWWFNQLTKLVAEIGAFSDPGTGLVDGVSAEHGLGIRARRRFASTIEDRSLTGRVAAEAWANAIAAIGDPDRTPLYGGLELEPQLGLLPLGPDPGSGLWEFAHLLSGEPAVRGDDGRLVLTEETGLVLVLLPGGSFWMGSQKSDPRGRNYDPWTIQNVGGDGPPHLETLKPFFLSKYEMTQAQWQRLTAENPSFFQRAPMAPSLLHPVEQVSWYDCAALCARIGLELPTEAQWEQGARAGTSTVWWTGNEPRSLAGAANLADRTAVNRGAPWAEFVEWTDGYAMHAPVDAFEPNPSGLHNVHGNVAEWCQGRLDVFGRTRAAGLADPASDFRPFRGGAFRYVAWATRSALRSVSPAAEISVDIGVRPARDVVASSSR